jgi:hypothetical protein
MKILGIFIVLICSFFICLFFYYLYLLSQKNKCAYIKELSQQNKNVAIKAKIKIANKQRIYRFTVFIDGETKYIDSHKSISEKDIRKKLSIKEDVPITFTFDELYNYTIKTHEKTSKIQSTTNINEKNIVGFKDPFSDKVYLTEEELKKNDIDIIDDSDLAKQTPKKLIKYFYNDNLLLKLYSSDNKEFTDFFFQSCVIGCICTITYVVLIFFR